MRAKLVRIVGFGLTAAVLVGAGWIISQPKARSQIASWFSMGHPQAVDAADSKVRSVANRLQGEH